MNVRKTPNSLLTLDPFHEGRSLWTQPRGSAPGEDLLYTPFQSDQEHVLEPSGNLLDLPCPPRSTNFSRSGEGRVRGFLGFVTLLIFLSGASPAVSAVPQEAVRLPDAEAVVSAIRAYVVSALPWKDAEVQVEIVGLLKPVELPSGDLTYRVAQRSQPTTLRRLLTLVEAANAEGTSRSFWVVVDVRFRVPTVRAARALRYGHHLAPEDVIEGIAEIANPRAEYLRTIGEAVGQILRHHLNPGDPLTRAAVTNPILVRRGETVRLMLERPGVQLSALVLAEQSGRLGQVIRVRNVDSSRPVSARVVGTREVRVY